VFYDLSFYKYILCNKYSLFCTFILGSVFRHYVVFRGDKTTTININKTHNYNVQKELAAKEYHGMNILQLSSFGYKNIIKYFDAIGYMTETAFLPLLSIPLNFKGFIEILSNTICKINAKQVVRLKPQATAEETRKNSRRAKY